MPPLSELQAHAPQRVAFLNEVFSSRDHTLEDVAARFYQELPARLNPLVDEMMMLGCFAIYFSHDASRKLVQLLTKESVSAFLFWGLNSVLELLSVFAAAKGFCVQQHS